MRVFTSFNNEVVDLLRSGKVGIVPTDTVYGIVCSALNPTAVKRLYGLKSRHNKPGTVIGSSVDQFIAMGITRRYLTAISYFWPNAISIIIPSETSLDYLALGKNSLALRIPKPATIHKLLEKTGPLLTTSANQPGSPTIGSFSDIQTLFGETVDFYVDGGDLTGRPSSTIIQVVDDAVDIIREGAVVIDPETGRLTS